MNLWGLNVDYMTKKKVFGQIIPVCPHICEFLCEYHQTWDHCLCPKSVDVTHPQEAIFFSQDEIPRESLTSLGCISSLS